MQLDFTIETSIASVLRISKDKFLAYNLHVYVEREIIEFNHKVVHQWILQNLFKFYKIQKS